MHSLSRRTIIQALCDLEAECVRRGIAGELCVYGGDQMVLVFDARESTRDVDAVLRPRSEILEAARVVAVRSHLPLDWLNDGVKGFLFHNEELLDHPIPELEGLANLRILAPSPEYLLAMKCLAARSEETSQDRDDVHFLIQSLKLTTEAQVFDIVGRFYPLDRLHVKSRYFVQEVLNTINTERRGGAHP